MIRPIACANCGKAGQALPRTSPSGRMCASCGDPDRPRGQCIQCGRSYRLHARWVTDGRCGRCVGIGRVMGTCAQCGRLTRAYRRLDDGGALCQRCAPRRVHQCCICGSLAPAHTNREDGPVCGRCYNRTTRPRRTCSRCGRERFIELSANAEHGDLLRLLLPRTRRALRRLLTPAARLVARWQVPLPGLPAAPETPMHALHRAHRAHRDPCRVAAGPGLPHLLLPHPAPPRRVRLLRRAEGPHRRRRRRAGPHPAQSSPTNNAGNSCAAAYTTTPSPSPCAPSPR
jgi:hypothetical protein